MAVNKRDLNTINGETGWPFVNYAQDARNLQAAPGNSASALSIPRFKFTWSVEFTFSPRAFDNPVTNLRELVDDNRRLYVHLLSIDHPQATFKTEKMRSYNKWIIIPTQVEYPQATMTFHDDSTSTVQALWKEHLNFYTHQATIGDSLSGTDRRSNLSGVGEYQSYQFSDKLTATDGGEMRSAMGRRPSLGMKLKPNDGRHFFESIVIADMGTEPDGVNVYWYHNPMITSWAHDNLDMEDRTGNVRVQASFDYEGYYFTIGQNRGRISGEQVVRLDGPRKAGIARDGLEEVVNRPVELVDGIMAPADARAARLAEARRRELNQANEFATTVVEPALESELNPTIPNSLAGKQQDLDQIQAEKDAIREGRVPLRDPEARLVELNEREAELNESIKDQKAAQRAGEFATEQEKSALDNTSEAAGVSSASPSSTGPAPERAVIIDDYALVAEGNELQREEVRQRDSAAQHSSLAESDQRAADSAAERGDTRKARIFQAQADDNRAKAEAASEAEAIAGAAADDKYAAADNARELNKQRSSLN